MRLYLVRHGTAKRKEEDPLRPLSDIGEKEIRIIAKYALNKGVKVDRIFHSEKLRAEQTAQIYSSYLKPQKPTTYADSLAPMDDPRIWMNRIEGREDDIMLVGHLPYMSVLSDLLLTDGQGRSQLDFHAGGTACLHRDISRKWKLEWMINPGDIE